MAKTLLKGCIVQVDDSAGTLRNISTDVESVEIEYSAPGGDVTGLTETVINYIPGQTVVSVTLNLFYNSAATTGSWTVVRGIIGSSTSKTVSVQPEGTGLTLSGEYMCEGVSIGATPKSAGKLGSVKFLPMGSTAPAWA